MAFPKGKSGNPSGRPKKLLPDGRSLADLAKQWTESAVNTLAEVMEDAEAPHPARVSAATALLDRGWGRPKQDVDFNGSVTIDFAVALKRARQRAKHGRDC